MTPVPRQVLADALWARQALRDAVKTRAYFLRAYGRERGLDEWRASAFAKVDRERRPEIRQIYRVIAQRAPARGLTLRAVLRLATADAATFRRAS